MNVKHEARVRVRLILEEAKELGHEETKLIPLTDYADEATYRFLLPNSRWTFAKWRAVNIEVAGQLRDLGYNVTLVPLEMGEYIDWLVRFQLKNTPQNRAQYVSWRIAPENDKPTPRPD